eukprot:TRINITY_DN1974_c0_g1_i4.p1 TRINITY_DN1974_c0_g1~~TRINITY_DN1974_c0_g1_i4.p1  ORF type:complete len:416 (+),score=85.41 TRINITY_DN1974_c0_g1_i4:78-1250(+)
MGYLALLVIFWSLRFVWSIDCPGQQNPGSLLDVVRNQKLQFIFVGGKGGVGKTTVASALALQLAKQNPQKNVLLISTDPAHSLSDAFRLSFDSTPKTVPGVRGLSVMEILPQVMLHEELNSWSKLAEDAGLEIATEVDKFRQWLTSIPGIDEATALSSVIGYTESGVYDIIVFDTAPTGHTLKLLQLPDVLQIGLNQLQSWQSKLWGYYQTFTSFLSFGQSERDKRKKDMDMNKLKKRLERKLQNYKTGIEKVAKMLKDNSKTTFIAVCIAEYLSVSETTRLLQQLVISNVHVSNVVVNQLIENVLETEEIMYFQSFLNSVQLRSSDLREKMKNSLNLLHARQKIQEKYLMMLKQSPEAECLDVIQVHVIHPIPTPLGPALRISFVWHKT